jgi:L-amino acid N-acyltransferase YncA
VYFYKAFTRPEYRGRGLHPAALRHAAMFFAERSIARLIAIVEYANWSSLRSHEKLGFWNAGTFVGLRGQRLRFARYPRRAQRLGIRFGHSSQVDSDNKERSL